MPIKGLEVLPSADIPQPHGLVLTRTGNHLSVWMEGDRAHPILMADECAETALTADLPQSYRLVLTRACNMLPIGTERDRKDRASMALQDSEALSIVGIP